MCKKNALNIFKSLIKDTFIYGISAVLPRLMNLVLIGLHTSILSTTAFSENTTFYVYAAFANILLTYGMETAFFRYYNKSGKDSKVFSTLLICLTTTTLLFASICISFNHKISAFLELPTQRFNLLTNILTLDTLAIAGFLYLRIHAKALRFALYKFLGLITYVIGNFFFLKGVPYFNITLPDFLHFEPIEYIFISNLLGSAVSFLCISRIYTKFKIQFDTSYFRSMISYGLPIMIGGIAFVINENLDKLLLKKFTNEHIMGSYSGCYKLSVFLTLFIQAFRMGVEPFIFNHAKDKNSKNTYALILNYFVLFACLGMLFVNSFLNIFKEILIRDESYWEAINIVPIILLANCFFGIYHNLSVWYKLTDKTHYGMYISIGGAATTVILNYLYIPIYGYITAAYTTLIVYTCMAIISFFIGRRHYFIPYNLLKISVYITTSLILSIINLTYINNSILLKIGSILIYLLVVFLLERNSLKIFTQKLFRK